MSENLFGGTAFDKMIKSGRAKNWGAALAAQFSNSPEDVVNAFVNLASDDPRPYAQIKRGSDIFAPFYYDSMLRPDCFVFGRIHFENGKCVAEASGIVIGQFWTEIAKGFHQASPKINFVVKTPSGEMLFPAIS